MGDRYSNRLTPVSIAPTMPGGIELLKSLTIPSRPIGGQLVNLSNAGMKLRQTPREHEYLDYLKLVSNEFDEPELALAYRMLSVVDGKAASLLQFNAVLSALYALLITFPNQPADPKSIFSLAVALSIRSGVVFVIASSLCALRAVRLRWVDAPLQPLRYLAGTQWPGDRRYYQDKVKTKLMQAICKRSRAYRLAWWLSGLAVLAIALSSFLSIAK